MAGLGIGDEIHDEACLRVIECPRLDERWHDLRKAFLSDVPVEFIHRIDTDSTAGNRIQQRLNYA